MIMIQILQKVVYRNYLSKLHKDASKTLQNIKT